MSLRLTSSALALMLMSAPGAFALTPQEVWDNWVAYYEAHGYEMTAGGRSEMGSDLNLTDVTIKMDDGNASATITLPVMEMRATGGADVRTVMPQPGSFSFAEKDAESSMTGTFGGTNTEILSTEFEGHQRDTVTAPEFTFTLDSMVTPEGEVTTRSKLLTLTLADVKMVNDYLDGGSARGSVESASAEYTIDMQTDSQFSKSDVTGGGKFGAIQGQSEVEMAGEGANFSTPTDMIAALRAGAAVAATINMGPSEHNWTVLEESEHSGKSEGTMSVTTGDATVELTVDETGLGYRGDSTAFAFNLTGSDMPAPVAAKLNEASFDIQFPLLKADEAQPFKFTYSLGGLTLDDSVWGMIDQSGSLPREPMDMDIDMTGSLKLTADLLDPAAFEPDYSAAEPIQPIIPVEINVNQMALAALGASLNASGKLTVPEGGSIDTPVGSLTAKLQGANALIQKLVGAGFISQADAGNANMMMMMFTRPVGDPSADTLESNVEFGADGSIKVNGQQMR